MGIQRFINKYAYKGLPWLAFVFIFFISCNPPTGGNSLVAPVDGDLVPTAIEPTQLFLQHCESCHGMNGDKGVANSANLKKTMMNDMQMQQIILHGSATGMMPFRDKLTDQEVSALIEYVKILKYR